MGEKTSWGLKQLDEPDVQIRASRLDPPASVDDAQYCVREIHQQMTGIEPRGAMYTSVCCALEGINPLQDYVLSHYSGPLPLFCSIPTTSAPVDQ